MQKTFMGKCVWRLRPDSELYCGWYDAGNGCIAGVEDVFKFNPIGVPTEVICSDSYGQRWRDLADILLTSSSMLFCAHAKYNSTICYYHNQQCVKLVASELLASEGYNYVTVLEGQILRSPSMIAVDKVGIAVSSLLTPNIPPSFVPKLYAGTEGDITYLYTRYGKKRLDAELTLDIDEVMCRTLLRPAIDANAYGVISTVDGLRVACVDRDSDEVRLV